MKQSKKKESQQTNKLTKKLQNNKLMWQVGVLAVLVIIALLTVVLIKTNVLGGGKQSVAENTVKIINTELLQDGSKVTLKEVLEEHGLYLLKLNLNGRELETYVTKDGKLFFTQAINLDEVTSGAAQQTQTQKNIPKTAVPKVLLFTMSFCPYGNIAEEAAEPVDKLLKTKVNFEPHYVIYSNYNGGGPKFCIDKENKYCSMHGIQELNQDVRELCAFKYQKAKFWDFVMKVNEKCSARNVDTCWEPIAKELSIDVAKMKSCQKDEAIDLLKKEVQLNKQYSVQGSPTMIINGVEFRGGRTPEAYKQGICSAFAAAPAECSQTLAGSSGVEASPTEGCE